MPLNNFGRIAVGVYRSAQPDAEALTFLRDVLDVTAVIKLNTDEEGAEPSLPGIVVHHIPLGLHATSDDRTRIITRQIHELWQAEETVLIHCTHGRDRTGFIAAAYQILVMGHSLADVLDERRRYGVDNPWAELANHSFTEALKRLASA